jgi:hypothetical protein
MRYSGGMRIVARFETAAALAAEAEPQLPKGGLLVRGAADDGLTLFAPVELAVTCGAAEVVVDAQVLQIFPGIGVAVGLEVPARDAIAALARGTSPPTASGPTASGPTASGPTASGPRPAAEMLAKIQRALTGDRDARMATLRDPNRAVHVHVLRNPGLTLDEVAAMARMTTVAVEVLTQLAQRREWGHRPEIAIALVRNPTVPVPIAVELVSHVSEADAKLLAKDGRTREPIARAARKRVLR